MNNIKHLTLVLLLSSITAQADCKIFTSPATDFATLKGSTSIALTISSIYYKKDDKGKKQMAFKDGQEAFLEFDRKAREYIQGECAKYNYSVIYNYHMQSTAEERRYNFYATYDYK